MLHRRTFLHLSACAVAQLAFQRAVRAQGYPDRPITLVVPFPAGGPTDVIARIFAERLRQALGQECGWSRGDHRRCAGYQGRA
jgi:tripartite-type tricarboxylate transporter receptor subunit TctC